MMTLYVYNLLIMVLIVPYKNVKNIINIKLYAKYTYTIPLYVDWSSEIIVLKIKHDA